MTTAEFKERIKGICGIRPANPLLTRNYRRNDPNDNFAMYEADRVAKRRAQTPIGDLEIWKGSGGARISPSKEEA